jgi:hypothetical protein
MAFGQWEPQLGLWTDPKSQTVFAQGIGWVNPAGYVYARGKMVDPKTLGPMAPKVDQYAKIAREAFSTQADGSRPPVQPAPRINPAPLPRPAPMAAPMAPMAPAASPLGGQPLAQPPPLAPQMPPQRPLQPPTPTFSSFARSLGR